MACTKDHNGGVCTCPPDRDDRKSGWPPAKPPEPYHPKENPGHTPDPNHKRRER